MKYIFISLIMITFCLAQNNEPQQQQFIYRGDTLYLNSNLDFFKFDKLSLGWMWGGGGKLSSSLGTNIHDAEQDSKASNMNPGERFFIKAVGDSGRFYSHAVGMEYMNARGITYEPVLLNDQSDPTKFSTRPGWRSKTIEKNIFSLSNSHISELFGVFV